MRKILVVAGREYQAAVRTRAFVIGLLVMPVLMGAGLVVQWALGNVRDTREKRFAVIDRSGAGLGQGLEEAVRDHNATELIDPNTGRRVKAPLGVELVPPSSDDPAAVLEQRFELSERVRQGELSGFLEIGPAVLTPSSASDDRGSLRYQTNRPTFLDFQRLAERTVNQAVQEKRAEADRKDVTELRGLLRPVPLKTSGLLTRDPRTGEIREGTREGLLASVLVPAALAALMIVVVMVGATPLMQGVVEEKMQRVAEVLLGSIRPFPLMLGKLLGMTGVTLTMGTFYLSGLWASVNGAGLGDHLSLGLLAWFLAFQTLAALLYGSLFIAVGAACSDLKQTQALLWPIMVLVMVPLFVMMPVLQEPNGPVASTVSFFPFATPTIMMLRLAIPPGPAWWEPAVGMMGVLLTTVACVWAAGRVFRVGLLMQGQGANLTQMMRWVVRG